MVTSHVEGDDAPAIATPTTMAQKRLPGRTLPDDYRVISDLRFTNLHCDKADYPEVKLTDIRKIAEKSVATKLRWPRVTALCNKRDIDAAFKRVRVRPDMCIILCAEFEPPKQGIEDEGATVLCCI